MYKLKSVALFLLFCVSFASLGRESGTKLVIFGDSLSDQGNTYTVTSALGTPTPPPQAYWEGRFSNGPIWAEYFAQYLGVRLVASSQVRSGKDAEGVNFAWGGATSQLANLDPAGVPVPGFLGQVVLFRHKSLEVAATQST